MSYRLVLSDVDSTLIANEVIDLLADSAGKGREVSRITERAMNGEIDFEIALRERVALLTDLPETVIGEVASEITYMPGAEELIAYCSQSNVAIGAVSGGFIEVLRHLELDKKLDFLRANSLEIVAGKLTGRLVGRVVDREGKAAALAEFARTKNVPLNQTIALGDGANDIAMIELAGLGIGFRAKPALLKVVDLNLENSLSEVIPIIAQS